jgi:predicted pyridoxine 5'-phosphate oxidase superfamily flavin-nucleotide-binding protein
VSTPFHPGELEAQRRAGGGPPGWNIRDAMPEQHRVFFAKLPFVVVATRDDDGAPLATVLAGKPGFVASPDMYTLEVHGRAGGGADIARHLHDDAPFGLLGIELATRRRNRANGVVGRAATATDGTLELALDVRQSFGNCPQYIHPRPVAALPVPAQAAQHFVGLDAAARATLATADTFFVATAARDHEDDGGVDVSHRGGPAGFVAVEGSVLTIPDYRGNRYFNTLGNLVDDPRAALLFVDFATGALLHLSGDTEIVWRGPEIARFPHAERLWRVHVRHGWRVV